MMRVTEIFRKHPVAMTLALWLLALRLVTAAWIPLTETTEARYGEIARKMLETGNWAYLLNTYDSPFWAKPPLYAWLSAASMWLFGVNEFGVRFPSIVLGLFTITVIYVTVKKHLPTETAWRSTWILATLGGFFVAMGTVMTDPSLIACVSLSLCSWWNFHQSGERRWGLLFFCGVGAGLLAKGPLAVVLIGLPIFFYLLIYGGWVAAITSLPWGWGSVLGFGLPAVWYAIAEFKTPGFLEYFVLGEHIYRFLKPGWAGDMFGNAHIEPRGMVWFYASLGLMPWTLLLLGYLAKAPRLFVAQLRSQRVLVFAGLWCLSHLVFFTLAANIIWPYFLPMAPAFAILCAGLITLSNKRFLQVAGTAVVFVSGLIIFAASMMMFQDDEHLKSAKHIIARFHAEEKVPDNRLAYFSSRRIYSAEFYTQGKIRWAQNGAVLEQLLKQQAIDYILLSQPEYGGLPEKVKRDFSVLPGYQPTPLELQLLKRR